MALASGPAWGGGARQKPRKSTLQRRYKAKQRPLKSGPIITIGYDEFASEAEYVDLRNSVMTMLGRYQPAKHFFIGLGRDPTPIMAFLHNLGGEQMAMNFPASGSGSWQSGGPGQRAVDAYFDKLLIPRAALTGGRDIVLFEPGDSSGDRDTLGIVAASLKRYLRARGSSSDVVTVAVAGDQPDSGRRWVSVDSYGSFDPDEEKHQKIEPHPSFRAGETDPQKRTLRQDGSLPAQRRIYGRVKRVIANRMAGDTTLAAVAKELFE